MNKVSIIIPAYNVERYISDCLDSVINQTYPNIEIILVNDGSRDGTALICEEYAKKDSRIIYINQQNQGVSTARNNALELVTGEYVLFLDSDDWLEVNAIELLLLNMGDLDILQFDMIRYINGNRVSKKFPTETSKLFNKQEIISNVIFPEKFEKKNGYYGDSRTVGGKLYKTEVIKNIRFNSKLKFYEDGEFLIKALFPDIKFKAIDLKIYHYRINDGSCTQLYRKNIKEESEMVVQEISKLLEDKNNINYLKFDMFCLNINNLIRKKEFSTKEIKEICKNPFWDIKNLKVEIKYCKKKRKILYWLVKMKMYFFVYIVCKLKKG